MDSRLDYYSAVVYHAVMSIRFSQRCVKLRTPDEKPEPRLRIRKHGSRFNFLTRTVLLSTIFNSSRPANDTKWEGNQSQKPHKQSRLHNVDSDRSWRRSFYIFSSSVEGPRAWWTMCLYGLSCDWMIISSIRINVQTEKKGVINDRTSEHKTFLGLKCWEIHAVERISRPDFNHSGVIRILLGP